jgi:hypothetical protein
LLYNGVLNYYKSQTFTEPIDSFVIQETFIITSTYNEEKGWYIINIYKEGEVAFRFASPDKKTFSLWIKAFELFLP